MMDPNIQTMLFSQVLQVTLLAFAVWWAARCFARNRPHLAHALWLLVLLKCITPPVYHSPVSPFCWHWPAEEGQSQVATFPDRSIAIAKGEVERDEHRAIAPIRTQAVRQSDEHHGSSTSTPPIPAASQQTHFTSLSASPARFHPRFWLIGLWLVGAVVIAATMLLRSVLFLRWLRTLPRRKHDQLNGQLDVLSRKLGVKRKVRVEIVDGPVGPAALGLWRPRIVLPQAIVENQTPKQLEPLLAHELIHLRRGDLLWSAVQTLATCVFWFHPLVWLASKKVSRESERSCDEETVASLGCCPTEYATCLLDVLEKKQRLRSAPVVPGIRQVDITSARLERVMTLGNGIRRTTPMWVRIAFVALAAVVLPGAAAAVQQEAEETSVVKATAVKPAVVASSAADVKPADEAYRDSAKETREYDISEMLKHLESVDLEVSRSEFLKKWLGYHQPVYQEEPLSNSPSGVHDSNGGSEVQAPLEDLTTLKHVGSEAPNLDFDLKNQKLSAFTTKKIHLRIAKDIKHFSQFGFHQIALKTRILSIDRETWASLGIPWESALSVTSKSNFEKEYNVQGPTVVHGNARSELEALDSEHAHVRSKRYVQKNAPTLFSILDAQQVSELVKATAENKSALIESSLQIVTFNGRKASVSSQHLRPFVTSVANAEIDGESVIQPVISLVPDGTHMSLTPVVGEDRKSIEINAELELSQILSVDTFAIPRPEGEPLTIQVPEVDITSVSTDLNLPDSKTLALSLLRKDDEENAVQLVVLVTGRIVIPAAGQRRVLGQSLADKYSEIKPPVPSEAAVAIPVKTPPEKFKITTKEPQRTGEDYQRLKDALLSRFKVDLTIEGHLDYEIDDDKITIRGNGIALNSGDGNPSLADKGTLTFLKDNFLIDLQGNVRFNMGDDLKITGQHLKYGAAAELLATGVAPFLTMKGDASWEFGQTTFQADSIMVDAQGDIWSLVGNAKVLHKGQEKSLAGQKIIVDGVNETIKVDDALELHPLADFLTDSDEAEDEVVSGRELVNSDEAVRPVGYLKDAVFYFPDDWPTAPITAEQNWITSPSIPDKATEK